MADFRWSVLVRQAFYSREVEGAIMAALKLLGAALALGMLLLAPASADPRIDALGERLPDSAKAALTRIPDQGRKLLALRSYLRSERIIEARWSWTRPEIDAYEKSDAYVTAMAGVAAVTKAFEIRNPGHTLRVNTDVRSLDEQIDKWNGNASVGTAGTEIDAASTKWTADNPQAGPDRFRAFLVDWKPATTASLAAPGLTAHGRGMAFDFQVEKDGKVIAGADTGSVATAWEAGGWAAKLTEAVKLSTLPFEGPLTDPNEPWHYDYRPAKPYRPEPKSDIPVVAALPKTDAKPSKPDERPPIVTVLTAEEAASDAAPQADVVPPAVVPAPQPRPAPPQVAAANEQARPAATRKNVKKAGKSITKKAKRTAAKKRPAKRNKRWRW